MLFNSYPFLFLFLPSVLLLYYLGVRLQQPVISRGVLLFGSFFFYAYWDIRFLPLLVLSIGMNYMIGGRILLSADRKRTWMVLGTTANLLLLFYFKYFAFAAGILVSLFGFSFLNPVIELPLGISFFTFTQIAFLADAYKGQVATLTPSSYSLFVTVFPHLIAGPILHHRDMMSQFDDTTTYRWKADNVAQGLFLFAIGLSKKVLIADMLAPLVKKVFDDGSSSMTLVDAWGAAVAYTLQLYFDFSGYSDMAIGLGLMFNIRLPINFNSPYKATSIVDFWRRWHMTLSQFLRDYLYIPLGGSRGGEGRKMLNLFLTMLLGGLWHGAGWTFVIWGMLHGLYLVINHLSRQRLHIPTVLAWPITLIAVIVGWVIFRAADVTQAIAMLKGMLGMNGIVLPQSFAKFLGHIPFLSTAGLATLVGETIFLANQIGLLLLLLAAVMYLPNSIQLLEKVRLEKRTAVAIGFLLCVCILQFGEVTEFLYFQF